MSTVIRVVGLNKTYGRRPAFFDLALVVRPDRSLGTPSLLRQLAGLACWDCDAGGSIEVLDRRMPAPGQLNGEVRRLHAEIG